MRRSMGAGPDLIAVAATQLGMLAELAGSYGVEFEESRGRTLLACLLGYVVAGALSFGSAGSLLEARPPAGASTTALFGGAATWALGRVFTRHFESGGTFASFDPAAVREYFQQEFETGRGLVAGL